VCVCNFVVQNEVWRDLVLDLMAVNVLRKIVNFIVDKKNGL